MGLYYYHLNIDGLTIDIQNFKKKYVNKSKIVAFRGVAYQDFVEDEKSIFCIFDTSDYKYVDTIKDLMKEFPGLKFDLYCEDPLNNMRYELSYDGIELKEITKKYNLHYYEENDGDQIFADICIHLDKLSEWQEYLDNVDNIDLEDFLDDNENDCDDLEAIKDIVARSSDFMDIINEKLEERYL
jgi:hypothetical protein